MVMPRGDETFRRLPSRGLASYDFLFANCPLQIAQPAAQGSPHSTAFTPTRRPFEASAAPSGSPPKQQTTWAGKMREMARSGTRVGSAQALLLGVLVYAAAGGCAAQCSLCTVGTVCGTAIPNYQAQAFVGFQTCSQVLVSRLRNQYCQVFHSSRIHNDWCRVRLRAPPPARPQTAWRLKLAMHVLVTSVSAYEMPGFAARCALPCRHKLVLCHSAPCAFLLQGACGPAGVPCCGDSDCCSGSSCINASCSAVLPPPPVSA